MAPSEPRILIVRLSAIGDVVHALPAANALRAAWPSAHLTWVVESRAAELLRGHGAINDLIVIERGWLKSPRAVMSLRRQLRQRRFEIAIDLQGLTKSAIVAYLSGAKRRIGYGGRDGRELSTWLNNVLVEPRAEHVIDRNVELLAPLGIASPVVQFNLNENPSDRDFAQDVLEAGSLSGRFAIMNPGAGWRSKLWPVERFAAVAAHLARRHALPTLVVWGGGHERAMADRIVADSQGSAFVAPPTNLRQLAALARRANLFIASDTGPLHIAAAVAAPCVGLYGPMPAERNGPYGGQHIALQEIVLAGRSRARRRAGPESMQAISIEAVCGACDQILEREAAARKCA